MSLRKWFLTKIGKAGGQFENQNDRNGVFGVVFSCRFFFTVAGNNMAKVVNNGDSLITENQRGHGNED